MNRRNFIQLSNTGCAALVFAPVLACSVKSNTTGTEKILLEPINYESPDLPNGKRIPFGWSAFGINPGETIKFKIDSKLPEANVWFRVSVAQEIWDKKMLHLRIPGTTEILGIVDICFSSVLVPYEVEIKKEFIPEINKNGLEVTLEAEKPLWIFNKSTKNINNNAFLPHILFSKKDKGNIDDFLNCFFSINSIQAFGWREGTVLDGLWQVFENKKDDRALSTIRKHFDHFFDENKNLIYESSGSTPKDNQVDGIESTIPFATLARLFPEHPMLKTVVKGWEELKKENGMIIDGTMVSAEGCYTVAYPMAVIGKACHDEKLKKEAIAQLKHRFVLINDNQLFLRYYTEGRYTYSNWARGAAWTLLGFARTMSELKEEIKDEEVEEKFREAVKIAISMQRENGLWGCFMHKAGSLPDTSGSAGICAAILTGIKQGFLAEKYRPNAEKCWNALQNYITPDGFLKGVAQDNRGGVKLQESDYRVIAQMGMGMMAQLYALL